MSASDDSNQAQDNTFNLGSLPQYDSQDLTEIIRKFQQENHGMSEEDVKRMLFSNISQPNPDTVNLQQLATVATSNVHSNDPYLEIVEQPKSKGIRFRYKCEGRSAGSIPGESSTNEHKTFPSVKINNFKDQAAIVVVSCVTKEEPYRPHPHTLVGKECRKGVCTIKLKRSNVATFPNLGIQCVTKKEIKDSLKEREQIRVDPYGTGYYNDMPKLQLNIVRLCFQAFLPDDDGKYTRIVPPVVSHPIFDKKAVNDLVVCRLSKQSGHAKGGDEVFMLCEKVNKDDIQVRFYEEVDEDLVWESYAEFGQCDVHRQFAIVFKTPPYKDQYIARPVEVYMQLFRPSDEGMSEPKKFQYIPNDPDPEFIAKKRKRKINLTGYFVDSNPNTPAFNLLTDTIKDEPEIRGAHLRDRIRAKVSRSNQKPQETVTQASHQITDIRGGVNFQNPLEQMTAGEVIIQTSQIPGVHHTEEVTHQQITGIHGHQVSYVDNQGIVVVQPNMNQNGNDEDDVMLADLPIGHALRDKLQQVVDDGRIDSGSLPSLSNLPSVDQDHVDAAIFQVVEDGKLHTDSASVVDVKSSPKMSTRGNKMMKK